MSGRTVRIHRDGSRSGIPLPEQLPGLRIPEKLIQINLKLFLCPRRIQEIKGQQRVHGNGKLIGKIHQDISAGGDVLFPLPQAGEISVADTASRLQIPDFHLLLSCQFINIIDKTSLFILHCQTLPTFCEYSTTD